MYINKCNIIQNVVSAIEKFMGAEKRDVRAQTASIEWTLKMALIFTAGAGFCGKGSTVNTNF